MSFHAGNKIAHYRSTQMGAMHFIHFLRTLAGVQVSFRFLLTKFSIPRLKKGKEQLSPVGKLYRALLIVTATRKTPRSAYRLRNTANICPSIRRGCVISISFPFRISRVRSLFQRIDRAVSSTLSATTCILIFSSPSAPRPRSPRNSNGESSLIAPAAGNKETSGSAASEPTDPRNLRNVGITARGVIYTTPREEECELEAGINKGRKPVGNGAKIVWYYLCK